MVSANFSSRLKELMDASTPKTTQQDLAKILNLTRQQISNYATGKTSPDPNTICTLAKYFNVTTDYLLGLRDIKSPDTDIQAIHNKTGLSEEAIAHLIESNWRINDPNLTSSFDNELDAYIAEKFLEFGNYMIEEFDIDLIMDIIRYCNLCIRFDKANTVKDKLVEYMRETFDDKMLKSAFQDISIDDGEFRITVKPEEAKFAILGSIAEEFKSFISKYADYIVNKHKALLDANSTESNEDTSDDE